MIDFAAQRTKMVDSQVRTEDVTDYGVLAAMGAVPRELFVPERSKPLAYIDEDLLLTPATGSAPARYLMEPAPFARLLQLAEIDDSSRVLDVGCTTGYSTAVIARIAQFVVALDSDQSLTAVAAETLAGLGTENVKLVTGALEEGVPAEGPYDAIILDGAVEFIPDALFSQMKEGGRLVAVVGYGRSASAMIYTRTEDDIGSRPAFNAHIPPLPGLARPKTFVF